jgi:hypothetical protein
MSRPRAWGSWFRNFGDLIVYGIRVADAELSNSPHFAGYPVGKDFATLFLPKTGTGEVAVRNERNDVGNELMFPKNGIDNNRDDRCQICFAHDLDDNDDKTAGLKDGTGTC